MASLNLGQDHIGHIVAKSYPLYLAVRMSRYGSLAKINPSGNVYERNNFGVKICNFLYNIGPPLKYVLFKIFHLEKKIVYIRIEKMLIDVMLSLIALGTIHFSHSISQTGRT